ncbi:MAG: hypothetical protein AAFQ87_13350 [Bacteroidota bacterium]
MNKTLLFSSLFNFILILGCQDEFAFETRDVNYEALGTGKLLISSASNNMNYYIDVEAKETYLLPLPRRNGGNVTVDAKGQFAYTHEGKTLYRAVPGEWVWEEMNVSLPGGSIEEGRIYDLEVDPKSETLYFIWEKPETFNKALIALALSTGEMTDLSEKTGLEISHFSLNPVSGDLLLPIPSSSDDTLYLYLYELDNEQLSLLFTSAIDWSSWIPFNSVLTWLPNGQEFAMVQSSIPDTIFRYDASTLERKGMFFRTDSFNEFLSVKFGPKGKSFIFREYESVSLTQWDTNYARGSSLEDETLVLLCSYFVCESPNNIYWWP